MKERIEYLIKGAKTSLDRAYDPYRRDNYGWSLGELHYALEQIVELIAYEHGVDLDADS